MATGIHPFQGNTAPAVFDAILNRTPQFPSALNPELDAGWDSILLKALEKDPDLRFQTALDLRDSLVLLRDRGVQASRHRPTLRLGRRRRSLRFIPLVALPAVLLGFVAYEWTRATVRTVDSLAILPFVNASGDPNKEYLSDGITENLINTLSQMPKFRVTARSLVFRFKDARMDPQKIGRELKVRAVLTGRVLERDGSLNIQTDLMNVEDGSQLWGRQYSRQLSAILALQDEIARDLSGKLHLQPTAEQQNRLAKRSTADTDAYQAYIKGRYYWNRRTGQTLKRAIEYFQ
jgi:TolB-like protein